MRKGGLRFASGLERQYARLRRASHHTTRGLSSRSTQPDLVACDRDRNAGIDVFRHIPTAWLDDEPHVHSHE